MSVDGYGIFDNDRLVSDLYGSTYAAVYELEHRTEPGGVWEGRNRSSFAVKRVTSGSGTP